MLFEKRFWPLIADGSVTVTFRRWRRPQVIAGRPYRTPGGIVDVTSVTEIDPAQITDEDAVRAGYAAATAVREALRGDASAPVLRIAFQLAARPDPRATLAATAELTEADRVDLDARLDRLDRASAYGPWTREVLVLIAREPAVRAGDLAEELGRERLPFKLDVRKLKNLGLTESLPVGYQLSARGKAYLGREANM